MKAKVERVLQWGRTLSSAESFVVHFQRVCGISLQWGRTLSSAESGQPIDYLPWGRVLLQWGRTLSSAESL